jgi:hypothetical protein
LNLVFDLMNIYIADSVHEAIAEAAKNAQAHLEHEKGVSYSVNDLKKALVKWLELSIEQLATDADYHCWAGDRSYAVNRAAFSSALAKLKPAHSPQEADELTDELVA